MRTKNKCFLHLFFCCMHIQYHYLVLGMEYRNHQVHKDYESNGEASSARPRWSPKQEQLVILESIYDTGVVNPPKDETTRIRKLLEDYGPVADANVFYWFQNRRSRCRRRTRQIQAKINREQVANDPPASTNIQHQNSSDPTVYHANPLSGVPDFNNTCSADTSNVHYQSGGLITIFINGLATEVPMGPLDMKGMFGEQDLMLYHSSGIRMSNTSFSSSLQQGESYYLVPRAN